MFEISVIICGVICVHFLPLLGPVFLVVKIKLKSLEKTFLKLSTVRNQTVQKKSSKFLYICFSNPIFVIFLSSHFTLFFPYNNKSFLSQQSSLRRYNTYFSYTRPHTFSHKIYVLKHGIDAYQQIFSQWKILCNCMERGLEAIKRTLKAEKFILWLNNSNTAMTLIFL